MERPLWPGQLFIGAFGCTTDESPPVSPNVQSTATAGPVPALSLAEGDAASRHSEQTGSDLTYPGSNTASPAVEETRDVLLADRRLGLQLGAFSKSGLTTLPSIVFPALHRLPGLSAVACLRPQDRQAQAGESRDPESLDLGQRCFPRTVTGLTTEALRTMKRPWAPAGGRRLSNEAPQPYGPARHGEQAPWGELTLVPRPVQVIGRRRWTPAAWPLPIPGMCGSSS